VNEGVFGRASGTASWQSGQRLDCRRLGAVIGSGGIVTHVKPLVHPRFAHPDTSGLSFEIPRPVWVQTGSLHAGVTP
jgi:hypothetical protein